MRNTKNDLPELYSLEAESAVIGSLLLNPKCFDDIEPILQSQDFYLVHHRHIFEAISVFAYNNKAIDILTLEDRLPDMFDHNGFMRSDVVIGFGKEEQSDEVTYVFVYLTNGNRFYSENGECYHITHWRSLPEPPPKEDNKTRNHIYEEN